MVTIFFLFVVMKSSHLRIFSTYIHMCSSYHVNTTSFFFVRYGSREALVAFGVQTECDNRPILSLCDITVP